MKYNLYINQIKAVELGITNINQAHIFDLLSTASTWATPLEIDGGFFYWVSRQTICRELELLSIKPDTVYRHLKALDALGLIEYRKDGLKDCINLTALGKSYHSDTHLEAMSEIDPNAYVGNKSEQTRKQIRANTEIDPIYPSYKHNTTNISNAPAAPAAKQSEIIESFYPNETSQQAVRDQYPNIGTKQVTLMIEDFKDSMRNRKAAWKDIQSVFRVYVRKKIVRPVEPTMTKQHAEPSYGDLGKIIQHEKERRKNGGKAVDISQLTNQMRTG
jgi:DNA-binding transcriptional ArsR family regulator